MSNDSLIFEVNWKKSLEPWAVWWASSTSRAA